MLKYGLTFYCFVTHLL